ncbi:MAG TPA: hypothetical protein VK549_05170 [Acidimicrobiia bacterium]|nr:hypothetical protein [Acidimicrobiia bacterium]
MKSRYVVVALGTISLFLGVAGCGGSSGPDVTVGSHRRGPSAAAAPAPAQTNPAGNQVVRYRGLTFSVPADWPVYDLASDPTRCVRFDVHAVYLGTPGADQDCPAHLVGKTDSVIVEPIDAQSAGRAAVASQARSINGLDVSVDPSAETGHNVVAAFRAAAVLATVAYGADASTAQTILNSFAAS